MADMFDKASEREEELRDAALRHREPEGPAATGQCLFCNHVLLTGQRWCDADCRDDWEAEERAKHSRANRYDD